MWIFKDCKLLSREEHEALLAIRNEEYIRKASKKLYSHIFRGSSKLGREFNKESKLLLRSS